MNRRGFLLSAAAAIAAPALPAAAPKLASGGTVSGVGNVGMVTSTGMYVRTESVANPGWAEWVPFRDVVEQPWAKELTR